MRDLRTLDQYRDCSPWVIAQYGNSGDETCGVFMVLSPIDTAEMAVVASSDGGWDHVSVSRRNRCPNWPEMEFTKRLFFRDDETAMQLHVTPAEHINFHSTCLHLWRPQDGEILLPPGWMVAMGDGQTKVTL